MTQRSSRTSLWRSCIANKGREEIISSQVVPIQAEKATLTHNTVDDAVPEQRSAAFASTGTFLDAWGQVDCREGRDGGREGDEGGEDGELHFDGLVR